MKEFIFEILKYAMGGALLALLVYMVYFFMHPAKGDQNPESNKKHPRLSWVYLLKGVKRFASVLSFGLLFTGLFEIYWGRPVK